MDDKSNPSNDINTHTTATIKKIETTNNDNDSSSITITNNNEQKINEIKTNNDDDTQSKKQVNNTITDASNTSSASSSSSSLLKKSPAKRNLGRSARKRKAKLRSIHEEIEQLLQQGSSHLQHRADADDNDADKNNNKLKQHADRIQTLPGVLVRRKEEEEMSTTSSSFSSDHMYLTSQLGFIPGNAICVVTRRKDIKSLVPSFIYPNNNDDDNVPVVLKLYPLAIREIQTFSNGNKRRGRKFQAYKHTPIQKENQIEPYPTIYWLTCPILKNIISLLEHKQYIKLFEDKLAQQSNNDDDFLKDMKIAHDNYGKYRWDILTADDKNAVINKGWKECLGCDRGVAGIRNANSIKCLHTHTAHYLSGERNNVVGKWVMETVMKLDINDFNINTK